MANTKDLLQFAIEKAPTDFAEALDIMLRERALEIIENRRVEIAQSLYGSDVDLSEDLDPEDEEDLDDDDLDPEDDDDLSEDLDPEDEEDLDDDDLDFDEDELDLEDIDLDDDLEDEDEA